MSLLDAAEQFASLDRSQIILNTKLCLHSQDQHSECTGCFRICPAEAITIGKPPTLNTDLCQSCLACLTTCPVGAYHADDSVADLLNCATHIEDQPVELLCSLHPHPESGTHSESIGIKLRGCLAGLGVGAYLTVSTLGLKRLLPRIDACRACNWQPLTPEIRNQIERANRFLSAWDNDNAVTCIDEIESPVERVLWDSKNPPLSRRDLFRLISRQGQVVMARAMENGTTLSKRQLGRDRMRLLAAVSHLPDPPEEAQIALDGFNFATLTISDLCTSCGTCAKACPTGALKFEKNEAEMAFSITFSAQQCIGCDLCDHVCISDAITLDHTPAFRGVFGVKESVLAVSGSMVRCERCRTLMAKREGVRFCPVCEYRRTHAFGSMLPKKAIKRS